MMARSYAELCFLATNWAGADASDPICKATHCVKYFSTEGHVAPDKISNRLGRSRHTLVSTTYYPIELFGEPSRATAHPEWIDCAPNAYYPWVVIVRQKLIQPIGCGYSVLVHENYDLAACNRKSTVTRS